VKLDSKNNKNLDHHKYELRSTILVSLGQNDIKARKQTNIHGKRELAWYLLPAASNFNSCISVSSCIMGLELPA
jgi:hypothetical protein